MGEILVHEFMTLDGIVDAPTWTFDFGFDPQMGEAIKALTDRSRAILLGRTTYEMFEPAWSSRTEEDDPGAPFFNDTQKYVVSSTLTEATGGTRRFSGRTTPRDPELKADVDGDSTSAAARRSCAHSSPTGSSTSCTCSSSRSRAALDHGSSRQLEATGLSLIACEAYDNGVIHLGYAPSPQTG